MDTLKSRACFFDNDVGRSTDVMSLLSQIMTDGDIDI